MFYRSLRMGILVVHHSTFNPSNATGSNPKKVQHLCFFVFYCLNLNYIYYYWSVK